MTVNELIDRLQRIPANRTLRVYLDFRNVHVNYKMLETNLEEVNDMGHIIVSVKKIFDDSKINS